MSAYINFYIRSKQGGPFIKLESFMRSTPIYEVMKDWIDYNSYRALEEFDVRDSINELTEKRDLWRAKITAEEQKIKFLKDSNCTNARELLKIYEQAHETIASLREDLDELEQSISCLNAYSRIFDTQMWNQDSGAGILYVSLECDPNSEKETE